MSNLTRLHIQTLSRDTQHAEHQLNDDPVASCMVHFLGLVVKEPFTFNSVLNIHQNIFLCAEWMQSIQIKLQDCDVCMIWLFNAHPELSVCN